MSLTLSAKKSAKTVDAMDRADTFRWSLNPERRYHRVRVMNKEPKNFDLDVIDALEPVSLFADVGGWYECTHNGCEGGGTVTQST